MLLWFHCQESLSLEEMAAWMVSLTAPITEVLEKWSRPRIGTYIVDTKKFYSNLLLGVN